MLSDSMQSIRPWVASLYGNAPDRCAARLALTWQICLSGCIKTNRLEYILYLTWIERRRMRIGAAMMGADYVWWHGAHDAKIRYMEPREAAPLLPETSFMQMKSPYASDVLLTLTIATYFTTPRTRLRPIPITQLLFPLTVMCPATAPGRKPKSRLLSNPGA